MAQDRRKALDDRTRKLSGGRIEDGKEHAAYQEAQQQLLAIQAEQQQNLAVARAESKASFDNNQTLAQAAELGAISAAEAEQMAQAGGQVTLNPATQSVLAKYGVGQPKFSRTQSHSQQVTKQNITINNNVTSNTTNDVKVPGGVGGPLAGRPLQFKDPQTAGQSSTNKFKVWISQAFARQNEEGAKRDREYRSRENSLSKSANRMMKRLEDVGKTIGTRMDPRKIGSTWQSQLKTLLLLFGFGYLTSNWTKVLDTVSGIEKWVKGTWSYFTEGGFTSSLAGLFGGKPGQPLFDSLETLFLGNEEEKGLFGHLKQFFSDMWDERAEAVKMVKTPEITDALNDPMKAIKSLFEYLSNILTAAFSGTEGIKKIRIEEAQTNITNKAEEYRVKNSTTDNTYKRKVNGEDTDVEWGTSAFLDEYGHKGYKGISHHMLEGGELTSKFGAESSVAQMSELSRLMDDIRDNGRYDTGAISLAINRLSKYAGKQGMIPIKKNHLTSILNSDEISSLVASGDLVRNVPYREVIRSKTEDDYYRNSFGNNFTDPRVTVGASAALNTVGVGMFGVKGELKKAAHMIGHGYLGEYAMDVASDFGPVGSGLYIKDKVNQVDQAIKDRQNSAYRIEYVRADSPERPGDIPTGNTVYLDEISKQGIKELSKGILSHNGSDLENISVNPEDMVKYEELLRGAANNPTKEREQIEKKKKELESELYRLTNTPLDYSRPGDNQGEFKFGFNKPEEYNSGYLDNFSGDNSERIEQIQKQLKALNNKLFVKSEIQSSLSDIAELEAKDKERDQKRQSDWDNSAAGRMTTAVGNFAYDMSNGKWGTYTEKLTANGSIDNDTLKYRKQYLFKILREKGMSDGAIAGIIGNLEGEGLGRAADWNHSYPDPPGSSKRSMGIAAFNSGGELPRLKDWANKNGLDFNKFETQAQYIANHNVINKILKETQGLSPEEALKKSAIIWGHDFEVFQGYDAADSHGNLIGKGSKPISTPVNSNDKYRADGKLYGDENYIERIQKGLNTYKTYSGSDLSEITIQSSNSFKQEDEDISKQDGNPKTFLQILKDKVSEYITGFGGMLSSANDKIEEAVSPITDEAKRLVLKDGKKYGGPITGEFLTYEDYLKNQNDLPEGLPEGLSEADWRNRVYDMTGSMPQNLKPREGKILSKYTKEGEDTKVETKSVEVSQAETPIKSIEKSTPDLLSIIDPENMKKQDDIIKDIRYTVEGCYDILERNLSANIANGMATSTVVDAVNQGTMASANASRNISRSIQVQQKNTVANAGSLEYSDDSYKDLV